MSKGEEKIRKILIKEKINFKQEYIFSDLKSYKQKPLRFDFALFNNFNQLICLIEYDGELHFPKGKTFYKSNTDFLKAKERDRIKNRYCLVHDIKLYRIPYWELENIDSLKSIILSKYLVTSQYHNDYLKEK